MEPLAPPEFNENIGREILQEMAKSQERPFTVSVMGQTGVGKTSLLKALFNKAAFNGNVDGHFVVGHVRPATKEPQTYKITGENGQILKINDLPGIGESHHADQNHLDTYEKFLRPSNLVIWAIQADNRSTTFDRQSLDDLLGKLDEQTQKQLMSKMVFVLTKVDILLPPPWIMGFNKSTVSFGPDEVTRELIQAKQEFFKEQFIEPFGPHIVSRTDNKEKCKLEPPFECEHNQVTYRGLLTKEEVKKLSTKYPQWHKVFERLYNDQYPVPCSARLKYYLPQLMQAILNRLGSEAVQNFKQVVDLDRLGRMSLDEARELCNFQIWNVSDSRKIFDLENGIFPDRGWDRVFYKEIAKQQREGFFGLKSSVFRFFSRRKQNSLDKRESQLSIELPLREV
jgi:predicted GTPase